VLRANVETQLEARQVRILSEFSLDNPAGALSQMIERLTTKHGSLSKDLQDKIDGMIKEFSLDEDNSALNRLMKRVESAQSTITSEFSLDNDQSALQRLKKELTTILSAHIEANEKFQEKVTVMLATLVTRREEELRSTIHGATFQDAVMAYFRDYAAQRGDVAEDRSNSTGSIPNCKVGDAVLHLGADSAAPGARIVVEAKEVKGYSLRSALEEIEVARRNRGAQHGVFVMSRMTAPKMEPVARHGSDVVVVWDPADANTNAYLKAAIEICRALCLREHAAAEAKDIDFEPIDCALNRIEKCAGQLEVIGKHATSIRKSSDAILKRVKIDGKALDKQMVVLRKEMLVVKQALGESDAAEAATPAPAS
jgi:hypothetical protein